MEALILFIIPMANDMKTFIECSLEFNKAECLSYRPTN